LSFLLSEAEGRESAAFAEIKKTLLHRQILFTPLIAKNAMNGRPQGRPWAEAQGYQPISLVVYETRGDLRLKPEATSLVGT
jgi:hypothetical protein